MTDSRNALERFTAAVRAAAAAVEGTTVTVCPRGDHLRVARRWQTSCVDCGEPISPGAVGLATWDDDRGCNIGGYSWQHGCGAWNDPTEHTVDLYETFAELPGPVFADDTEDELADVAVATVDAAIAELDAEIAEERERAAEKVHARLVAELALALDLLGDGDDPDNVTTGGELYPGVYRDADGQWTAWDYDPRYHPDEGEIITVTEGAGNRD